MEVIIMANIGERLHKQKALLDFAESNRAMLLV